MPPADRRRPQLVVDVEGPHFLFLDIRYYYFSKQWWGPVKKLRTWPFPHCLSHIGRI